MTYDEATTPQEANEVFKSRIGDATDSELLTVERENLRQAQVRLAEERQKAEKAEEREAKKKDDTFVPGVTKPSREIRAAEKRAAKPESKPKGPNMCRKCGDEIPPTGKRGRPAVVCGPCKEKA